MALQTGAFPGQTGVPPKQISGREITRQILKGGVITIHFVMNDQDLENVVHWNSLGAKSAKARRHESHSCAVSGDSKYTFLIPA